MKGLPYLESFHKDEFRLHCCQIMVRDRLTFEKIHELGGPPASTLHDWVHRHLKEYSPGLYREICDLFKENKNKAARIAREVKNNGK